MLGQHFFSLITWVSVKSASQRQRETDLYRAASPMFAFTPGFTLSLDLLQIYPEIEPTHSNNGRSSLWCDRVTDGSTVQRVTPPSPIDCWDWLGPICNGKTIQEKSRGQLSPSEVATAGNQRFISGFKPWTLGRKINSSHAELLNADF